MGGGGCDAGGDGCVRGGGGGDSGNGFYGEYNTTNNHQY